MATTVSIDEVFTRTVETAMQGIMSAAHRAEGSYVQTPLLYPSGSAAVVRVSGGPETYFVTDFGLGYSEAEMMGATLTYIRKARRVGESAGVSFDDRSFFAIEVSRDRIPGAIVTIANCSVEAASLTAFSIAERVLTDGTAFMIESLERAYGSKHIVKNDVIVGASNHEWEFPASVTTKKGKAVFEFATKSPVSIAAVATKMADVHRLPLPPKRLVMVHSKPALGTYLGVLSPVASVIEDSMSPEEIKKVAEALAA
jgi:hypothetical protein